MTNKIWHQPTQGDIPPNLQPLIGKRVYRAWTSPSKLMLLLKLEGGLMATFEAMRTDHPGRRWAVEITVGTEKEGATWDDLDEICPQTPHLKALRGLRLTGLEGPVVEFDRRYGARITPAGIEWVKAIGDADRD